MSRTHKGIGISLSHGLVDEIDAYASQKGISRAQAIRVAIGAGLPLLRLGHSVNATRTIQILEHTQLVLSLLAEREYPDEAGQILQMAKRNAVDYHG